MLAAPLAIEAQQRQVHEAGRSHIMRSSGLLLALTASLTVAILCSHVTTAGAQKRGCTLRVAYGNEIAGLDFHATPGYEMVWSRRTSGAGSSA